MLEEDKMSYDETDVDNQNAAEQDCETEEEDGSWYGGLPIVSATEALALVEGANSGGLRRSIADLVLNFDDISVDSVSLHNLTNVFLTSHDFEYALNLAKLGLDRFPRSVTHLADAVQACARLGLIEEGMAFVFCRCDNGTLDQADVSWDDDWAVSVVLTSAGYPGSYEKGKEITGIEAAEALEGVTVYHAGTKLEDGKLVTNGGRVLNVTAVADSFEGARELAYKACELIDFEGKTLRHDIGARALRGRDAWEV